MDKVQEIERCLDNITKDVSNNEYVEILEELISDYEIRLEALRHELEEKENEL